MNWLSEANRVLLPKSSTTLLAFVTRWSSRVAGQPASGLPADRCATCDDHSASLGALADGLEGNRDQQLRPLTPTCHFARGCTPCRGR